MATTAYTVNYPAPVLPGEKRMSARYPGTCSVCRESFRKTTEIYFSSTSRQCRHIVCEASAATTTSAPRVCNCRCDGWCEDCSSFGCFANNHGRGN